MAKRDLRPHTRRTHLLDPSNQDRTLCGKALVTMEDRCYTIERESYNEHTDCRRCRKQEAK